jgi:hypothetical protein
MKREVLVPIDEEIHKLIIDQQQLVLARWTEGCPHLFPGPTKNPDGRYPTANSTYRLVLHRWLQLCDVPDEHGRPAHFTPQWRAYAGHPNDLEHTGSLTLFLTRVPALSGCIPAAY